jgi:starch synthase
MYSLRYGTIPLVRHTGGLADSIVDANPSTIVWGKGTGFVFGPYDMRSMLTALRRALKLYREDKALWAKLIDNAMAQDFSWDHSAREYETLMKHMIR